MRWLTEVAGRCRYRAHVHARKPLPELLLPERLIFLRPLADQAPEHAATPLQHPALPSGRLEHDRAQNGGTPAGDLAAAQRRSCAEPHCLDCMCPSGPQLSGGSLPEALDQPSRSQSNKADEEAGKGTSPGMHTCGEQWDAVWLQPRQLMDEGILLSSQWRRHHSGPIILAALTAALHSCSS